MNQNNTFYFTMPGPWPSCYSKATRAALELLAAYLLFVAFAALMGVKAILSDVDVLGLLPFAASAVFEGWGVLLVAACRLWRGHARSLHAVSLGALLCMIAERPIFPIGLARLPGPFFGIKTVYLLNFAFYTVVLAIYVRVWYEERRAKRLGQYTPVAREAASPVPRPRRLVLAGAILAALAAVWLVGTYHPTAVRGHFVQKHLGQWRWCDVRVAEDGLTVRFSRSSYAHADLLQFEATGAFLPPPIVPTLPLEHHVDLWGLHAGLEYQRLAFRSDLGYELRLPHAFLALVAVAGAAAVLRRR